MRDAWRKPYHVVIEVENKQCRMLKKLSAIGLKSLKVVDIRSARTGAVKHLIELDRKQINKIPKELHSTTPRSKREDKPPLWFESEGCEVCNTILFHDAFLISGKSMEEYRIMYSFIAPTLEAYTSIVSELDEKGHKVNILKMGGFEPKSGILTKKQEKVFWLALKGGFFDYPRQIGMEELSSKLGIRPSTLSEILRRGMRRLLEQYFEKPMA